MMRKKLTTAMLIFALTLSLLTGCTGSPASTPTAATPNDTVQTDAVQSAEGLTVESSMELRYAENFSVDYCQGGYKLVTISDGQRFLTVPEGAQIPAGLDADITVLQMPISNVLISSTPTMSFINRIGGLDHISMTTSDLDTWYIEEVIAKMESGDIKYIGDYKAPDFEALAVAAPPFAVFSTMLNSVPEVADKLRELNIPVLLDQATFESHPLGRTEWMKLYGALFDLEEAAVAAFDTQTAVVDDLTASEETGKTAVIFYITSAGNILVRNAGDYVVKMLELAGGSYILAEMEPDDTGNTQMEAEAFFSGAGDADYIIYIHSLGGRPEDIEAFVAKNEILGEFKAVKEGNVWCTTANFFQVADTLGYMIKDINTMLTSEDPAVTELEYLFKLK